MTRKRTSRKSLKTDRRNIRVRAARGSTSTAIRWMRRTKRKDRQPQGGEDRAKYDKLRDHLLRLDDEVTCKTCGKKFEVPSHHSLLFTDQLEGLPKDEDADQTRGRAAAGSANRSRKTARALHASHKRLARLDRVRRTYVEPPLNDRRTIVFYVSGHGFGHASRAIEVINALIDRRPDLHVIIRSSVAPWLVARTARAGVELSPVEVDTGMIQLDSLRSRCARIHRACRGVHVDVRRRGSPTRCGFFVNTAPSSPCRICRRSESPRPRRPAFPRLRSAISPGTGSSSITTAALPSPTGSARSTNR